MTSPSERAGAAAGSHPAAPVRPNTHTYIRKNRCKCDDCRHYGKRATKLYYHRQHQRDQGQEFDIDLIDAKPYTLIIKAAVSRGMTYGEMQRLTGVRTEVLNPIGLGRRKRIQRKTARAIARGLLPDKRAYAPKQLVPLTPWHKQIIPSLNAQGWTCKHLKQIITQNSMGSTAVIDVLPRATTKSVQARSLKQLLWLVEVIGDKRGPSERSISNMQHRGIFPLRHYDRNGRLREETLSPEQRRLLSKHGAAPSSDHGPRPHAG